MIKIKREDLINYIKDNIDTCLDFTDIELNLELDGTFVLIMKLKRLLRECLLKLRKKPI